MGSGLDIPNAALPRLAGLVLAASGCVALGLVHNGLPPLAAAALCVIWAAVGWLGLGPLALGALPPALALLPGGGWLALAGWAAAGMTAAGAAAHLLIERQRSQLRPLRNELRDAEHERQQLHAHLRRYPVLLEACLELSAARDPDQFATELCRRARALAPDASELRVFLGSGDQQSCRASQGRDGQPCPREPGPEELYVASEARLLTRRPHGEAEVWVPLRGDRRQAAIDPLRPGAEALRGVLYARIPGGTAGDHLAMELLQALGRLGGLGLAAVDLLAQARGLALHDHLTGLYGQHEFLRRLDEAVAHARRHGEALTLVMCDMDHLKAFNDRFGHAAGDAALQAVAKALRAAVPARSVACRYGGEEFAILLPGQDLAAAAATAEELRAAIAEALPDATHPERRVSASLGVALHAGEEGGRETLRRADAACYRAKAAGRNRVVVAA